MISPRTHRPGGDVNVTDSDGDTPLYLVEDIETAQFLIENGAVVQRTNNEGISVRGNVHSIASLIYPAGLAYRIPTRRIPTRRCLSRIPAVWC